ncbi:cupin domain-containing protein [Rhodanobacter sp. DHG33]|uniref:cupin domain-containing protein n=1 Tax=Rhodanobacter sp. DHG33 TaxID=2775921 RepID=UPI00177C13CD|nr:cupin domain-containing protein [Rhodanobacter sp. DHG33]MBD8900546.1 cupin domain-containing protein [Rhodanobacter sp. DHG33]
MPHPSLLTAADIEAMEAVARPHPLNPNALRLRKSLGDATGLTQLGVHRIELPPGRDSSEYHRHLYEEEFVYVLAGHGRALIDEQTHDIAPGDFLGFARNGPAHVITNTGDAPLVLLVAGQRLEQDICDYPHRRKRLYVRGEQGDLVDFDAIVAD